MKIEGTCELAAPRETVWDKLMDPALLARCLPGVESLESTGDNTYKASLKIGIAAIKGAYSGTVSMTELDRPNSYKLIIEGKGIPGFVRGIASVTLGDKEGKTELRYSSDVQVGGLMASIGQRMIQGAASSIIHQFFASFENEISAEK